jgi:hypothetical protein
MQTAAGWYTDPSHPQQLRWWDGVQWTEYTYPTQSGVAGSTSAMPYAAAPRKRPKWLIPVVAGAVALLLVIVVGVGIVGGVVVSHVVSAPYGVASLKTLVMSDSEAPAQMGRAEDSPSKLTTAGAAVFADQQDGETNPVKCVALTFEGPTRVTDATSKDPVQPLGTFAGNSKSASENAWVQATARSFSSVRAAQAEVSSTSSTVKRCRGGYSASEYIASRISLALPKVNGLNVAGWSERDEGNASALGEYYALDFQKKNVVVRAVCYVPTHSTYDVSSCEALWRTVVSKLAAL